MPVVSILVVGCVLLLGSYYDAGAVQFFFWSRPDVFVCVYRIFYSLVLVLFVVDLQVGPSWQVQKLTGDMPFPPLFRSCTDPGPGIECLVRCVLVLTSNSLGVALESDHDTHREGDQSLEVPRWPGRRGRGPRRIRCAVRVDHRPH